MSAFVFSPLGGSSLCAPALLGPSNAGNDNAPTPSVCVRMCVCVCVCVSLSLCVCTLGTLSLSPSLPLSRRSTELSFSKFAEADLRDARFDGAKVDGASFVGANCDRASFAGALGVDSAFWAEVKGQIHGLSLHPSGARPTMG